jgi:hypothetical protein
MIIYRVQATRIDTGEWVTEWHSELAEARKLRDLLEAPGHRDVHLTRHEVDTNREDMVWALNHANVNFTVWPGEEIK